MNDCYVSNQELTSLQYSNSCLSQVFFFTRNFIRNSVFFYPCGSAECANHLFNSVGVSNSFEFHNSSFIGKRTSSQQNIVKLRGSNALFQNCLFENNTASTGGVIKLTSPSSATFLNCSFINNSAQSGGVIYGQGQVSLTIQNSVFRDNRATKTGGVFFFTEDCKFNVTNATFVGNESGEEGSVGHLEGVSSHSNRMNSLSLIIANSGRIEDSLPFRSSNLKSTSTLSLTLEIKTISCVRLLSI